MKTLKLSMLSAALLLAGLTTVKAQTADEVVKKYVDAIGGDKWNSVNSIKVTSSMVYSGMTMEMTETTVNNKAYRWDMSMSGTNNYTIVTPTEGWSYMPMMGQSAAEAMKAEDLKGSQEKLDIKKAMHVNLTADAAKTELVGKEKVDDMECYNVKITDKDNKVSNLYFDSKNYYLVCVKGKQTVQGQEMEITQKYSDYQKQDNGVLVAMKMEVEGQASATIKSVEINKPIDDSVFKPAK